jgi:hypothetical protein
MSPLNPTFTITNRMTAAITKIERARGFLEAAHLSEAWVRDMRAEALIKEAHHTTHIEGTQLTLEQAERLWKGEEVPQADPEDTRELLNYRDAFEFVSECLDSGDPITGGLETQMTEVRDRGERSSGTFRAWSKPAWPLPGALLTTSFMFCIPRCCDGLRHVRASVCDTFAPGFATDRNGDVSGLASLDVCTKEHAKSAEMKTNGRMKARGLASP